MLRAFPVSSFRTRLTTFDFILWLLLSDIYGLKLSRSSTARTGSDIWDASSDSIIIGTTSSDTTFTVTSGAVGIGTTSPDRKLHVFISDTGVTPDANSNLVIEDNDSNNFINVLTNNTSQGGIFFGDSDDSNIAGMLYNHSDDTLRFRTNNTNTRLSITSGGNVGIGTDSPTRKLHINGGSASATSIYIMYSNFFNS